VLESEPGWRLRPACTVPQRDDADARVVVLGERTDGDGSLAGRVEVYGVLRGPARLDETASARWTFTGAPAAASVLPGNERLAVLCHREDRDGTMLRVLPLLDSSSAGEVLEITDERSAFGSHPGGMTLSRDGSVLFVLSTGYAANRPSGEPVSWLHVLSARELAHLGEPLELPGVPNEHEGALCATATTACWVLTRSPGSEFAYATQIGVENGAIVKKAQVPLTEVSGPLRLAQSPSCDDVAVAINNRLELWRGGVRGAHFEELASPVTALSWNEAGLFAGGAGWLHRMARRRVCFRGFMPTFPTR